MGSGFRYYSRTITSGCLATAAMVALAYARSIKPGGLSFLLLYSMFSAIFASFLAALLVRRVMPHLDAQKIWIWLAVGGGVELALVVAAGYLARYLTFMAGESSSWMQYLRLLFSGQIMLFPKWWLGVPIGAAIGAAGYAIDVRETGEIKGQARPLTM